MGLGMSSASRIRIPRPPQNKTTFIVVLVPLCLCVDCYQLFKPSLTAEMLVLLGTELVSQTPRRQRDVTVSNHAVFRNVVLQHAAFYQDFRQILHTAHFIGI